MKKIKKLLTIGLAVLLMLCISISLVGCSFLDKDSYLTVIEKNWKFVIPEQANCKQTYVEQESNIMGDGTRYHVFAYEEEIYIANMCEWQNYQETYEQICETWLTRLDVPSEKRPIYQTCQFYQQGGAYEGLIICWNEGNDTLYICESFM